MTPDDKISKDEETFFDRFKNKSKDIKILVFISFLLTGVILVGNGVESWEKIVQFVKGFSNPKSTHNLENSVPDAAISGTAIPGSVTSGDAASGDAKSGNGTSGDARSGNAMSGRAIVDSGSAVSGDAVSGNAVSGKTN